MKAVTTSPSQENASKKESKTSPSSILAKKIAERLLKEKLIEDGREDGVQSKIIAGSMKESDWRLESERSLGMHKKS